VVTSLVVTSLVVTSHGKVDGFPVVTSLVITSPRSRPS
jgi:hypothetical protein